MEVYNHYGLEDFLVDERFNAWVTGNGDDNTWNNLALLNPEKNTVIQEAREIILSLREATSDISDAELEKEVSRILAWIEEKQHKPILSFVLRWKWLSAAAVLLLILGFGWEIVRVNQPESVKSYHQYISKLDVLPHEVINVTDKPMQVKLPDGSRVQLTPDSRVSYADNFIQNKKREIYLSGEAFFEVQKDSKNPFFVYANGLLTRVVGTSFSIETRDHEVEVIVRTGRVAVLPIREMNSANAKKTIVLTPNQQALFSAKDNLISKSIVALPIEIQEETPNPDFTFENKPIGEVFQVLEKVYGIPILYDHEMMRNCSLRVALSNEPFFSKLDIICETLNAEYAIRDGQVIVSGKGCEQTL